jgi:integrase
MDAEAIEAIAARAAEQALARFGAQRAPAPSHTLNDLHAKWAVAHSRLGSFKGDDARARRLLGVEPFELRDEETCEKRLAFWAPSDGPYSGMKLGERDVSTLLGDDIDDFRTWFYQHTTRRKGPPETATVNRYVMVLKRILNHAVKRNIIQRSPLLGFDDEDEDNAREVVITEEQLDLLLTAFGDDSMMRALVLLGYDSGMRLTELLNCRRSWLDKDAGFVHVPGAIAKNGEARITDLSVRAWDACDAQPRHLKTDLVFPNPETAAPWGKRWIHEKFVRAVERAGIVGRDGTPPRLHDLRRSFITLAGARGVPETVIMAKSGHKDHAVFRRYRIVPLPELREAWLRMEAGRQAELAALAARRAAASSAG